MALRNQPYFPLYVQDYLTDEKLNNCSAASQGIYIKMMCLFHKCETYGGILLKQNGKQNQSTVLEFAKRLAKQLPFDSLEINDAITELLGEGVLTLDGDFLFQKRMVKDNEVSNIRASAGKKGGKKTQIKDKNFALAKIKANSEYENEYEIDNEIKDESKIEKDLKPKNSKQEKKPESEFPEYKESMQAYHDFYKSRTGVSPSIKSQDGKALKELILHFRKMATDGNTVLDGLLYIFNHWQKLDDFTQKQIDISKIYTNINSIISQLKSKKKNGNTNTGNTDYESAEFRDSMFAKIDAAYGKK